MAGGEKEDRDGGRERGMGAGAGGDGAGNTRKVVVCGTGKQFDFCLTTLQ